MSNLAKQPLIWSADQSKSQQGLSLIELLVALTLGLFVAGSALQVFVGSRQSLSAIQANSSMQESARFSFYFMNNMIRQAGYLNTGTMTAPGDISARELYNTFNVASLDPATTANQTPYVTPPWGASAPFEAGSVVAGDSTHAAGAISMGIKNNTDVIQLRLQGEDDGSMLDCEGQPITSAASTITFFVGTDDQLYCQVNARPHVALVSGVENLQVEFGVSSENSANPYIVDKYTSAPVTSASFSEWTSVLGLRMGLITSSENTSLDQRSQTFTLLDAGNFTFNDRKSRRAFTQTVGLRSNMSQ